VSVPTLASLGVGKAGFVFSGDEAFGLAPASREAATQFLRSQGVDPGERFALLHMRATDYTGTTERYYGSLAKALDMACVQSQVLFVPMSYWRHSGRDEQCGQAIRSRMERPERLRVLESVAHVALVRQIIAMSSWVLSLSYHLQVFALASARPFGILASGAYYLAKARGMSGLTGGLAPLLDLGAATPADLAQTMECLEHQDDSLISGLRLVGQRIARVNDAPVDALAGVVL
jgi:polysaccharide pyruvyl transferase WcaK-like protein